MGARGRQTRAIAAALIVLSTCFGGCSEADTARPASSADERPDPREGSVEAATTDAPADSSTTSSSTTSTTAPPEVVRTLAFGGDVLIHLPVAASARRQGEAVGVPYDFGPLLAPMAPVLSAVDLALCHLEVPLVADGQAVTGYPSFRAPREVASALLDVGYDGCSLASNHSLDGGMAALSTTLYVFDSLGLGHVGTARSAEEDVAPRIYDLAGVKVAHLSYSYGFNGYQPPPDAPWAVDAIDPEVIARDAVAARSAGAQMVVVSLHWGTEYQSEPDAYQTDMAAQVTGIEDVDLVIGHHAHVVQPVEMVNGKWVVWGLGNQLSNQGEPPRRDGLTVRVRVAGVPDGRLRVEAIEAVPTWVDLDGHVVLPVVATLARADLSPTRRAELEASLARTEEAVNRRGAAIPMT